MIYQSTRNDNLAVSSAEAIVKGIAADGGLFVPAEKPKISIEDINRLSTMNYRGRACGILSLFLSDYTSEEINECVENAYNKTNFETDSIAPLYELTQSAYILELWHGPTCAFKDMALQILPHLLTKAMKKTGVDKEVVILVATSGDTGKAALEGFCDIEGTKIIVFFPNSGVSEIQKLQMLTQDGGNVLVSSVFGNFDDAQNGVKKIFNDTHFSEELAKKGYQLSSANSINWGRLVPQIIYYISAYCDLIKSGSIKAGDFINVCVPTGNFGNILAAWYAKSMGLPIAKLICASNENNVLTEFISTGIYDKNREFKTTISPSMDILISSNLERLLFDISDSAFVAECMDKLSKTGKYEVTDEMKLLISANFYGGYCDDAQTLETIKNVWNTHKYLIDTHTAVACKVYEDYTKQTGDVTKTVIASTANPFKFNSSVLQAVSDEPLEGMNEFQLLDLLSSITGQKVPESLAALKTKSVRFNTNCQKEEMPKVVEDFLK